MKLIIRILFLVLILHPKLSFATAVPVEGALIRDAEIEDVLESYITPIFKVAGLDPKSLDLYIVNSSEVNAFAMGGGRIGMNTGLILKADSASEVIGVLAHETAHLAGKHMIRGVDAYEKALLKGLIGVLGGIALAAGGSPEAGTAVLLGSQDVALRGLLKFSRDQEGAADQGAANYLDKLKWSSEGMLKFMKLLHNETFYKVEDLDPYLLTHPLTNERMDFFASHVAKSPFTRNKLPSDFESNFKRIQVKIEAFLGDPVKTLRKFPPEDKSMLARYGRSIAYLQTNQIEQALSEVNSLLTEYPNDPYFWDLKGQILFESGNTKAAAAAYEQALQIKPETTLFRINLAHALIENEDNSTLERVYQELLRAKAEEPENPFTFRLLAIYYGKKGNTGLAALSLAEMAYFVGDLDDAEKQAKRSLHLLKGDKANTMLAKELLEEIKREKDG